MKNFIFSFSMFLVSLLPVAHPQPDPTGKITGYVYADSTSEPLIGASVYLFSENLKTERKLTDVDGIFNFQGVSPGIYKLKFSYLGYDSLILQGVDVKAGKTTDVGKINLNPGLLQCVTIISNSKPRYASCTVNCTTAGVIAYSRKGKRLSRLRIKSYLKSGMRTRTPGPDKISNKSNVNAQKEKRDSNTVTYGSIIENPWLSVSKKRISTFSIDVDNASYCLVRKSIGQGRWPQQDDIRYEELINYFKYDYPQPKNGEPVAVFNSAAQCPWDKDHQLVEIGIQGMDVPAGKIPPCNFVFLIDVSGSMEVPTSLPLVKTALKILVGKLRNEDRISIVTYAGQAGLALPATSGGNKKLITSAIDKLEAGGSTAGGEGIMLAYRIARNNFLKNGNNRIILSTDGDFNVGVSDDASLVKLIKKERDSGIYLSVLGVGEGNFKDIKMEKLADNGNGNYYYIDDESEARKVLDRQFAGTMLTVAKDVKIQVKWNPRMVKSYRLIGYENRMLKKSDFKNDKVDAGDLGAGHSVTALYEIIPADDSSSGTGRYKTGVLKNCSLLTLKMRYKKPGQNKSLLKVYDLKPTVTGFTESPEDLRWAAAVASYGMLIRGSVYKGQTSYEKILDWANTCSQDDPEGLRKGFISLVQSTDLLQSKILSNRSK